MMNMFRGKKKDGIVLVHNIEYSEYVRRTHGLCVIEPEWYSVLKVRFVKIFDF